MQSEVKLTIHSDDAHSYIEVSEQLISHLKIGNQISSYSFISPAGDTYFLEGDLDGDLLIEALCRQSISFVFEEKLYECPGPFRAYPRVIRH
jgi:hypothetical protein